MRERIIHTAQDGTVYSDKITVFLQEGEHTHILEASPDMLYLLIRDGILKMSLQEQKPQEAPLETIALRNRVSKMAKQALRGALLLFGNDLLTLLYGSKEHEKVPKGVDSLDWYTNQFTKVGVAYLLKQDMYIVGHREEEDEHATLYTVDALSTQPVTG